MPRFNDIDLNNWKDSDVETDSLWIINSRDNSGKHDGFYHGNFVPQIPRQLFKRYTKKGETVLDPFMGSGTSIFEAESLNRKFYGIDIQRELVEYVRNKIDKNQENIICGDSAKPSSFASIKEKVQFVILHPPYSDIIKFSGIEEDLSNISKLEDFRERFKLVLKNSLEVLEDDRYLAIVIGDKYSNGEWIPLGFYLMEDAKSCGLRLKSVIIKNMDGNRAKQNKEAIWRFRALSSDYYIFKHEYIFVFKKEKHK